MLGVLVAQPRPQGRRYLLKTKDRNANESDSIIIQGNLMKLYIGRMKKKKATKQNRINIEMLNYGGFLLKLRLLQDGNITRYQKIQVTAIYMKIRHKEFNNYRCIGLTETAYRIYMSITKPLSLNKY